MKLFDRLELKQGSRGDYHALAEHHYRAGRPATLTRVLTLMDQTPGPAARWRGASREYGPAAVLVESLPALRCRSRDHALGGRYGNGLAPAERARLLNRELRCISRVVVDPRWRGMGLAVWLVREALRSAGTTYTEALAAMGRINPFFERAGMTAYPRPVHAFDARLLAALAHAGLAERDLASVERGAARIEAMPASSRRWLEQELRRWHQKRAGRPRRKDSDLRTLLASARDRLRLEPVYYLHDNRDGFVNADSPRPPACAGG